MEEAELNLFFTIGINLKKVVPNYEIINASLILRANIMIQHYQKTITIGKARNREFQISFLNIIEISYHSTTSHVTLQRTT